MTATLNPGRAMLLATVSEADFQRWVINTARRRSWLVHSYHDSRTQDWGADSGWPDLTLVRNGVILAAELKKKGGRATAAQLHWLTELELVGVRCFIWRPEDEAAIEAVLA